MELGWSGRPRNSKWETASDQWRMSSRQIQIQPLAITRRMQVSVLPYSKPSDAELDNIQSGPRKQSLNTDAWNMMACSKTVDNGTMEVAAALFQISYYGTCNLPRHFTWDVKDAQWNCPFQC